MKYISPCLITLIAFIVMTAPSPASAEISPEIHKIMARAMKAYEGVLDYTCSFDKTELVGRKLIVEKNILLKYRKPASVYMKWTEGKNKGQETIYVRGRYKDELQVHPGGMMGFVDLSLNPRGKTAMKKSRHPITEAGIGFTLGVIYDNYRMARDDRSANIQLVERGDRKIGRDIVIEATLPPDNGYYAHIVRISFDSRSHLLSGITAIAWDGRLLEQYSFRNFTVNTGFTDLDFDIKNPSYGF